MCFTVNKSTLTKSQQYDRLTQYAIKVTPTRKIVTKVPGSVKSDVNIQRAYNTLLSGHSPLLKVIHETKAYIPPERKPICVGAVVGSGPQHKRFALPIPTCWYPKSLANPMRLPNYPTRPPIYPQSTLGMQGLGLHWPCRFHIVYVNFLCVGYTTRTRFPVE